MKHHVSVGRAGQKYNHTVQADIFNSTLEVPNGRNPNQNAWLTITINYTLRFADTKSQGAGIVFRDSDGYHAKDSDDKKIPIKDWDLKSQIDFNHRFLQAESIWNHKFLLVTPKTYDGLDFTSMGGNGWLCRPNVICLFRLNSGGSPNHLPLTVVRAEKFYRSNALVYTESDVKNKTVAHELGHALDQLHIKALLGDQKCLIDNINADDCYDTPAGMEPNIMGRGTGLLPLNAKAWKELIGLHTGVNSTEWQVSMATSTPPRKLQLGFQVRGVMPAQW